MSGITGGTKKSRFDITLFDPATVIDAATFAAPTLPAKGIEAMFVGGAEAWRSGASTFALLGGKVLKRLPDVSALSLRAAVRPTPIPATGW